MTVIHKTVAERDGMDFVLSDETLDRYGDVIKADGWDLKWFKKNPIALWAHDSRSVIGNWENVRVEGKKLIGTLKFAAKGTSDRIDELIALVEQGVLRAVSVGFRPLEQEPIDKNEPWGGQRYIRSELLETSLVAVPANPAALALAKSLHISDETLSLAFGEHAEKRRDLSATGEHADTTSADLTRSRADRRPTSPKGTTMKTISQRVEDAESAFNAARDAYNDHVAVDDYDIDQAKDLKAEMDARQERLDSLKEAEKALAARTVDQNPSTPAQPRRPLGAGQKEVSGLDLLVRAAVVRGVAHFGGKTIEKALEERYPGHEATSVIVKADQTIGTTTVSGWASELVQTVNAGFVDALTPYSIYPALRSRGIGLSFDGIGTVSIPSRSLGGAGGGFVAEGSPIRVGRITTAATTMTPRKLGVIVPFSRELAKRSTPAIEALVRQAILEDTAVILDTALIDATASSTARPAGLLNGVTAAASGYGGGDWQAVIADFKALLAPFFAANAADNITVIMNPAQGLALSMMPGADGTFGWFDRIRDRVTILESTTVPAGRLIALRNSDFATALGDAPEFDVSEQATVHMEDTTPLEIVSAAGTVADPTRSFFQTATIGVRMLMDLAWKMRRSGMVQWIDGTSW